ncbi:PIN domain-containing protein [Curtobacterium flaccumfaciens pv. flaccumfaciens]|uniref:PIN domain-containing protein n=1 Tax=Curtobacterium flaccumfaciens TaxID=2035 RepID=UPI001BD012C1|nr:PIN domain-containing protein [Curtobacterium flaccumfaciens]MCS6552272.1 PIN domain-containing protein [Curtobacterium flaccumfaciens pv. flaccumfaciens]QVG65601.1 PIN domain-containing protein [Curtobacterium flaccumfaciens pv. flaccumfaciens]
MATYIVDNSVWWKAHRSAGIARRLREIATQDLIMTCPPQVLEYCHSARTGPDHQGHRDDMDAFLEASEHPDVQDVTSIQNALWNNGHVRGAGPIDVHIAAYAMRNGATVLSSDRDYDHIADAVADFRHEYLPEH